MPRPPSACAAFGAAGWVLAACVCALLHKSRLENAALRESQLELNERMVRRLAAAAEAPPMPQLNLPGATILPVLREWGCGANLTLRFPRMLDVVADRFFALQRQRNGERNGTERRVVVDVGLGWTAEETLKALLSGHDVIAFEPHAAYHAAVHAHFMRVLKTPTRDARDRVKFLRPRSVDAGQLLAGLTPPPPRKDGIGFAYVINAALGAAGGSITMPKAAGMYRVGGNATAQCLANRARKVTDDCSKTSTIPIFALDSILPAWASRVLWLKVDVQGLELPILRGAQRALAAGRVRYVTYEFSPWLMRRAGEAAAGAPLELASLLPALGATCFDLDGLYNKLPRPDAAANYTAELDSGNNCDWHTPLGTKHCKRGKSAFSPGKLLRTDKYGPWEDILCYFPDSSARNRY